MTLEYRFLLRLDSIENNRERELMEFMLVVEPRSGKNKWRRLFEKSKQGLLPILHRSNNELMIRRMAWSIYQNGGHVLIEDLACTEEAAPETVATPETTAAPETVAAPETTAAPAAASSSGNLNADVTVGFHHVDHNGHVAIGTLSRLLEALRYQSIREDAFSMRELFVNGAVSVVRAQEITLLDTIKAGDNINIDLKLVSTQTTSLRLGHKVTRNGEPVARCSVIAVHLNKARKPTSLPDGVQSRVTPDIELPAPPKIAGPAPKNAWSLKTIIRHSDLDALQHANQGHIIRLLDDARLAAREKVSNADGELRRIVVNYERELLAGDNVNIVAWNSDDVLRMDIRRGRSIAVRAIIETA